LCRLAENDGVGAAGPGQFQPGGDQAVADGAAWPAPSRPGGLLRWSAGCHSRMLVDSVH